MQCYYRPNVPPVLGTGSEAQLQQALTASGSAYLHHGAWSLLAAHSGAAIPSTTGAESFCAP